MGVGYPVPPSDNSLQELIDAINAIEDGSAQIEVKNDEGSPVPVSGEVRAVDAAELSNLMIAPFTITSAGSGQVLVAAPGGGSLLRLRRLSPTYAIRSPDDEPILVLKVGSEVAQQGNSIVGRFDLSAAADTDAITLDVDVLGSGGRVVGTVYYEIIP